MVKFYIKVFLCYGQGPFRRAILYGDRSCYKGRELKQTSICFSGSVHKPKGTVIKKKTKKLGSDHSMGRFLPLIVAPFREGNNSE